MMRVRSAVIVFGILMGGCAAPPSDRGVEAIAQLPADHFKVTARLKDDDLDTVAIIDTWAGLRHKQGLFGIVWDDNFLRAFIDKKTGRTTFQLYQVVHYQASGWNFYDAFNFSTPEGPQTKRVTVISRDVDCKGAGANGRCTYTEHLGADLDEDLLRSIERRYEPGKATAWKFKFLAKSGAEYTDGMFPAEVVGLLRAVDEYKSRMRVPTGAKPVQPRHP